MSDEYQIEIPQSFMALYVEPGRQKPTLTRDALATRYELCEDMAQMLVDTASTLLFSLGITESDVLVRVQRGLVGEIGGEVAGEEAVVSPAEASWVLSRLAELLNWKPLPATGP